MPYRSSPLVGVLVALVASSCTASPQAAENPDQLGFESETTVASTTTTRPVTTTTAPPDELAEFTREIQKIASDGGQSYSTETASCIAQTVMEATEGRSEAEVDAITSSFDESLVWNCMTEEDFVHNIRLAIPGILEAKARCVLEKTGGVPQAMEYLIALEESGQQAEICQDVGPGSPSP